jgi:hypothetical protein
MLGSLLNTRPELRYYGPDSARVEIMSTDDLLQELESLAFRLVPVGGRWYIDDIRLYSQPLPRRMRPETVRQANYPR